MSATTIKSAPAPRRTWILQGIVATAFLAAGAAKLAGADYMVQLFDEIGVGQWFRYVTGVVEVAGALALVVPGLAWLGGLGLGTNNVLRHTDPPVRTAHQPGAGDRARPPQRADRLSAPR